MLLFLVCRTDILHELEYISNSYIHQYPRDVSLLCDEGCDDLEFEFIRDLFDVFIVLPCINMIMDS